MDDPFDGSRSARRGQRYPADHLTGAELDALLSVCNRKAASGCRDAALVALMVGSGLRIGEALALRVSDVRKLENGTPEIFVRAGKSKKSRKAGLMRTFADAVQSWLARRAELGIPKRAPLFCGIREENFGKPLKAHAVRDMLRRRGAKAVIAKRMHPHLLRHTHAVALKRAGVSVEDVRRQLGHASLAVTAAYLASLDPQETLESVAAVDLQGIA